MKFFVAFFIFLAGCTTDDSIEFHPTSPAPITACSEVVFGFETVNQLSADNLVVSSEVFFESEYQYSLNYSYDVNDRLMTETSTIKGLPDQIVTRYTYDDQGRIKSVVRDEELTASYEWENDLSWSVYFPNSERTQQRAMTIDAGLPQTVTVDESTVRNYIYDNGKLVRVEQVKSGELEEITYYLYDCM